MLFGLRQLQSSPYRHQDRERHTAAVASGRADTICARTLHLLGLEDLMLA